MSIVCEISGQERRKDGGKIPSRPREIPMHRRSLRTPERFRSAAHRLPATPGVVHYWKSFSFSHKSPGPEPRALLFSPCQGEGLCFMSHCVLNTRRNLGKWLAQLDEVQYFIFILLSWLLLLIYFFVCVKRRKRIHRYIPMPSAPDGVAHGGKTRALVCRWRCEPNKEGISLEKVVHLTRCWTPSAEIPGDPLPGWEVSFVKFVDVYTRAESLVYSLRRE